MLLALGELSDLQFMRGFTLFKFIIGGLNFELKVNGFVLFFSANKEQGTGPKFSSKYLTFKV